MASPAIWLSLYRGCFGHPDNNVTDSVTFLCPVASYYFLYKKAYLIDPVIYKKSIKNP
jgi:hypothetical protein